jgi:hypothetical protein
MSTESNWVGDIDRLGCVCLWVFFAMWWPNKRLGLVYGLEGLLALICRWRASGIDEHVASTVGSFAGVDKYGHRDRRCPWRPKLHLSKPEKQSDFSGPCSTFNPSVSRPSGATALNVNPVDFPLHRWGAPEEKRFHTWSQWPQGLSPSQSLRSYSLNSGLATWTNERDRPSVPTGRSGYLRSIYCWIR